MPIRKITFPDLQFTGSMTPEKLRRLNDELRAIATALNQTIDAINGLMSADSSAVASHVLATTSALGPEHTVSGLESGMVLKASAENQAAFAKLQFAEMYRVDPNSFNAVQHGYVLQFWDGFYSMRSIASFVGAPQSAQYVLGVAHASLPNARTPGDSATVAFDISTGNVIYANVVDRSIGYSKLQRPYSRHFMLMGA